MGVLSKDPPDDFELAKMEVADGISIDVNTNEIVPEAPSGDGKPKKNVKRPADGDTERNSPNVSEKETAGNEEQGSVGPTKTQWMNIKLICFISFVRTYLTSIHWGCLYVYLLHLDSELSMTYFAWLSAVANGFQFGAGYVFTTLWNKGWKMKTLLFISIALCTASNCLFLALPVIDLPPTLLLFVSTCCLSSGSGILSLMKNFTVVASTIKDRDQANAANMLSYTAAIVVAAMTQMAFSEFGHEGFQIFGFNIDLYTGPMVFALAGNILNLIFRHFIKNLPAETDPKNKKENLRQYDHSAYRTCLFTYFAVQYMFTNIDTVSNPFYMESFGWNKQQTVFHGAWMSWASGVIQSIMNFRSLRNSETKADNRSAVMLGLIMLAAFHGIIFPFWFIPFNGVTSSTMGVAWYMGWYLTLVPLGNWLGSQLLNTVFNGIIGDRDQSNESFWSMAVGVVAKVMASFLSPFMFGIFGLWPSWTMGFFLALSVVNTWRVNFERLLPNVEVTESAKE